MGWQLEPLPPYFSRKHVIIGFPHTSNMDAVRAFVGYWIIKRTGHIMVKKEWFFWPMSLVFKIIGGIPIDRGSSQGAVEQMADIFNRRDEFLLAIVPEGTRKKVKTIKKGFWYIAKAANVSIICWFLDNKNKKARWLAEIIPGENMMDDLIRIRDIYEKAGYPMLSPSATNPALTTKRLHADENPHCTFQLAIFSPFRQLLSLTCR